MLSCNPRPASSKWRKLYINPSSNIPKIDCQHRLHQSGRAKWYLMYNNLPRGEETTSQISSSSMCLPQQSRFNRLHSICDTEGCLEDLLYSCFSKVLSNTVKECQSVRACFNLRIVPLKKMGLDAIAQTTTQRHYK